MEGKEEEEGRNKNPHCQTVATPLCPPFPSSAPHRHNPGYGPAAAMQAIAITQVFFVTKMVPLGQRLCPPVLQKLATGLSAWSTDKVA